MKSTRKRFTRSVSRLSGTSRLTKTAHDAACHGLPTVANPPPSKKERLPRRLSHETRASKINKYRKELGKDLILFLANCGTTPHDSALHSNDSVSRGFDSRGSSMMRPTFNAQADLTSAPFRRI